jgi:hypothetical protein
MGGNKVQQFDEVPFFIVPEAKCCMLRQCQHVIHQRSEKSQRILKQRFNCIVTNFERHYKTLLETEEIVTIPREAQSEKQRIVNTLKPVKTAIDILFGPTQ